MYIIDSVALNFMSLVVAGWAEANYHSKNPNRWSKMP